MKKRNEHTRDFVNATEIKDIYRTNDQCLYTVYKDDNGNYYMDAYDGASEVIQLNSSFSNDAEAIAFAQSCLDDIEN